MTIDDNENSSIAGFLYKHLSRVLLPDETVINWLRTLDERIRDDNGEHIKELAFFESIAAIDFVAQHCHEGGIDSSPDIPHLELLILASNIGDRDASRTLEETFRSHTANNQSAPIQLQHWIANYTKRKPRKTDAVNHLFRDVQIFEDFKRIRPQFNSDLETAYTDLLQGKYFLNGERILAIVKEMKRRERVKEKARQNTTVMFTSCRNRYLTLLPPYALTTKTIKP